MTLGKRLRELREARSLTLVNVADKFNMSKSGISAYETDVRKPSLEVLIEFAELYGVTADYLLGATDNKNIYLTIENIPKELLDVGIEYISLAKEMEDKEIPAEDIKKIIEVIKSIKD